MFTINFSSNSKLNNTKQLLTSLGLDQQDSNRGSTLTADRILPRQDEALSRPTEYPKLQDAVLSQPTEYLLRLRKYYNGRQSTRCCRIEYSHERQSTCYNRRNTITADRIFPQFAQASSRPTEYLMLRNGILSRPTNYLPRWRKHSHGRQSTYANLIVF